VLADPVMPGHPGAVIGTAPGSVTASASARSSSSARAPDRRRAVLEAGVSTARARRPSRLHPRVTIGHDCVLGRDCTVAGTVVGADGFGFASGPQGWEKIAQLGAVVIGDSVEIGAGCAIDRARSEHIDRRRLSRTTCASAKHRNRGLRRHDHRATLPHGGGAIWGISRFATT
jgi:acetyltransferase-like isoleucine patch superfamily enzyme